MKLRTFHLWLGLIACIIIFLEAMTGLLLVHTNWLGIDHHVTFFPVSNKPYQDDVNIAEALQRVVRSGQVPVEKIRLVMNHSLGEGHHGRTGDYSVRLRDENQTLYIFDTKGNLIRKEVNVLNNIIRDFHYGELAGYDLTWLIDIAAIAVLLLTLTGAILGIQDLCYRKKINSSAYNDSIKSFNDSKKDSL